MVHVIMLLILGALGLGLFFYLPVRPLATTVADTWQPHLRTISRRATFYLSGESSASAL